MAKYDFDGMFGDRYSTEQAINSAMFNEAMSFGQLDRSKYAPMTASTYGQAYMGSAGIGQMLGGQHPMMKRQNLLDEIQKKFPDPRTPDELNELAAELSKNGFGDLAMQVKQVAMEMSKNEATKAYNVGQLKKPSSDQLKMIPRKLNAILGNAGVENNYLKSAGLGDGKNYLIFNPNEWGGKTNRTDWTAARERHLTDMKTLVQEYSDHKQGVSGWNLDNITTAIGDDNALKLDFVDYIKKHTNRTHTNMLLDAMGVEINTVETDDKDNGEKNEEPKEVVQEGTTLVGSNVADNQLYNQSLNQIDTDEQIQIDATKTIENMGKEERQALFAELSVQAYQSGTFFLNRQNKILYDMLRKEFGDDADMALWL